MEGTAREQVTTDMRAKGYGENTVQTFSSNAILLV